MFLFYSLLEKTHSYLNQGQISFLAEAFLFAADAHETQFRSSGEPYITHPVAVTCILADMRLDVETLAASLMHDVVEDTDITLDDIKEIFGEKVALLVDGVTKLTTLSHLSKAKVQAESFRKMVLAMAKDIRVILIKLADRLHNMSTLDALKPEKKRRIAKETMEIYAPIANRLGMHAFKSHLEDLAFKGMYPLRYRVLVRFIEEAGGNRKRFVEKILEHLRTHLVPYGIPPEHVCGRRKRLYSIFRKMRFKGAQLTEIMDVYAFRIFAADVPDCYRILGLVHSIFKPVPGRFKDYIAIPKANGYQSLHTSLFGPHGVPVEIQIRTQEMHNLAENGIAAHWLYKDQVHPEHPNEIRTQEWLKNLLDMQKRSGDSFEFIENVKIDLFSGEVYVFTPKGDILELPVGATVLDFAYAVHTEVGNQCTAARLNRRLVPLNHVLENGDRLEIITSQHVHPMPSWLNFVVTGKAKAAIKHSLKEQEESESLALGRKLFLYALAELKISWDSLEQSQQEQLLKVIGFGKERDLFKQIGSGELTGSAAALGIRQALDDESFQTELDSAIIITGEEQGSFRFCKTCWPLPGDEVRGVLVKGGNLEVHVPSCKQFQKVLAADRQTESIPMKWSENITIPFPCEVRLSMVNRPGVLAKIANALSDLKINLQDLKLMETEKSHALMTLVMELRDRIHLARMLKRLRGMKEVMKVTQVRSEI